MSNTNVLPIIRQSVEMTEYLCVAFEDRQIDYSTFLKHTGVKVKFMRNQLQKPIDEREKRKIANVLQLHSSIIHKYNHLFIKLAQQG